MKRRSILKPLLALLLACWVAVPMGAAATEAGCSVNVYTGIVGNDGLIVVPVVAEGCPPVAGYQFAFDYDSDLFEIMDIVPAHEMVENFDFNTEATHPIVIWYHSEALALEGELFHIILRPKSSTFPNDHGVVLRPEDSELCDAASQAIPAAMGGDSHCYPFGDASRDGTVNVCDQQAIYSHINKTQPLDPLLRYVADMNGDGEVNVLDQQILYRRCIAA